MKIYLGSLEITVDIENPSNTDILDLKLREIVNARGVSVRMRGDKREPSTLADQLDLEAQDDPVRKVEAFAKNPRFRKPTGQPPARDYAEDVGLLHAVGFPDKTIVMISKHVLGVQATHESLTKLFPHLEKGAEGFLSRKIKDKIWALYAAQVELVDQQPQVMVLGLNEKNQIQVLGMKPDAEDAFQDVIDRGVDAKKVQIGILSFHLGAQEEFKEKFPKAGIQFDWQEYIDITVGFGKKEKLKAAMGSEDNDEVTEAIDNIEGPRELLTYLDFPEKLHRALRTSAPIRKIEKTVNAKARKKGISEERRQFIATWELLRLQYQWLKVPVDSPQLSSLRHIKAKDDLDI